MITKVRGSFNEISGTGFFDAADPTKSTAELTLSVASIDTRNADRDTHLKSADFFDADKYPEIKFTATGAEPAGDNQYRLTGDLTIRDVTRPITFDVEVSGPVQDPWGYQRIGLEGSVEVNRKDWGLTWNVALEAGGILVSEKVTLEFEISAVKAA
jgi:polyisoprenoid-binding protein YceI